MKIQPPDSCFGQFLFFFVTQCVAYFVVVANTRAFTQGNYFWTAITDTVFAAQQFVMIKIISKQDEKKGWWAGIGYTLGGTCGSLASIWVTKHVYGA